MVNIQGFEEKNVISVIHKYKTGGHSPYLVLTNDYQKYVLKAINNKHDKHSLIKEFLCTQLLQLWGITACQAAILTIHEDIKKYLNSFQQEQNSHFGSLFIEDAVDAQGLISNSCSKITNLEDLVLIGLFDIWVENDDRKPENHNLILAPSDSYLNIIPIDHAYTFASLDFLSINSEHLSFSYNDSILLSPMGQKAVKNWRNKSSLKNQFYSAIDRCHSNFSAICSSLPADYCLNEDEQASLYKFLFDIGRNEKVFGEFCYIISKAK